MPSGACRPPATQIVHQALEGVFAGLVAGWEDGFQVSFTAPTKAIQHPPALGMGSEYARLDALKLGRLHETNDPHPLPHKEPAHAATLIRPRCHSSTIVRS